MLLADFGFSQTLLDDIKSFLDSRSTELGSSTPGGVSHTSFGSSPASLGCAGDASKAQQHVKQAIVDMVTGLEGYVDALNAMQAKAYAVEDVTEAELRKKWHQAESCQTPDFSNAGVCSGNNG